MKYLAMALFLMIGTASLSQAQTVKGGGSVSVRAYNVCRWNTNPACQTELVVVNTSDKFGVTKIKLDVPGIAPIETWIPPLGEATFFVGDANHYKDTEALNKLVADAVVYTSKKPKNASKTETHP